MLNHLRKNTKLIIWLIVGAFGVWGAGSVLITGISAGNAAGRVFGKKISHQEFNRHYRLVQIFGGLSVQQQDPALIQSQAWQQIAMVLKARKVGITVTDEEVRAEIVKRMASPDAFNQDLYTRWVRNVFGESPGIFEEKVRDLISVDKLVEQVTRGVTISEEALRKKYAEAHPESAPEDFEKVKEGYRKAMIELAKLKKRDAFVLQVIQEAKIRSFLEEEKKLKEEVTMQTPVPGSPQPIRTPVPPPAENKNK